MVRRPLTILVLLSTLLAGCALEPTTEPTPAASPPAPSPSPLPARPSPAGIPRHETIFADEFRGSTLSREWSLGYMNPDVVLRGEHAIVDGGLRLWQVDPSRDPVAAYGVGRALDPDPSTLELLVEANVRASALDRYGLYVKDDAGTWVGAEFDQEGFCLCANTGAGDPYVDMSAEQGELGRLYHIRLVVDADGFAKVRVNDAAGTTIVDHGPAMLGIPASEASTVWIAIWSSPFARTDSDYTTESVRVSRVATS